MFVFVGHGYDAGDEHPAYDEPFSRSKDERGFSRLTVSEMHDAIKRALESDADSRPFDILIMNSCMSNTIELNFEFRDIARYVVGSPDFIPLTSSNDSSFLGIDLLQAVTSLKANPDVPEEELCRSIIDASIDCYQTRLYLHSSYTLSLPVSFSCIALEHVEEFADKFGDFGRLLRMRLSDRSTTKRILSGLYRASTEARHYGGFHHCDLIDLLDEIRNHLDDQQIQSHTSQLKSFLQQEVVRYERNNYGVPEAKKSYGLSVFFPHPLIERSVYELYSKSYRRSQFANATIWDELLDEYRSGARASAMNEAYLKEIRNEADSVSGP
jgi:hypothetical protein